jgi:type IV secretion system protein VirD4
MKRQGFIRGRGGRPIPIQWLDPVAASPIEIAAGGLIMISLGLVGLVWGAAVTSSWLVNGEVARVGVTEATLAMIRLGTNRFRWEGAWDPATEATLAGPFYFWLAFALESLGVGLLFWPAWRMFGPRPADPMPVVIEQAGAKHPRAERRKAERTAVAEAKAQVRDLQQAADPADRASLAPAAGKILISEPDGQRLVLGRVGRALVATEKHHSVIALGPTQSGKTSSLSVPAILEWSGPVIVCTAKADVVTLTWDNRVELGGSTWLFDPMATMLRPARGPGSRHMMKRHGWSPLHVIDSVPRLRNELEIERRIQQWVLTRRTAQWMVRATRNPQSHDEGAEPVYVAAEQMLAPLLLAAATEELPIGQVGEWIDRRDRETVGLSLERTGVTEALAAWEGTANFDSAMMAGVLRILAVAMYPYGDPTVAAQAREPQISARQLFDGRPNTLYVLAPPQHGERLRPLLTTLISEVIDTAMTHATASSTGRLAKPLLVVIDDAVTCAPAPVIDQLAAIGAGLGIQLISLFQDLGQMERAFGRQQAVQLANDHQARVILPGISDGATLNYVSALIRGNRLLEMGDGPDLTDQAVVGGSANWMRTLEDGNALCVYGNLPPIRMALRPWFAEPGLHERINPRPTPVKRYQRRRRARPPIGGGFPNPLDSEGNDREAARYWDAVVQGGTLPEPRAFDDGSNNDPSSLIT